MLMGRYVKRFISYKWSNIETLMVGRNIDLIQSQTATEYTTKFGSTCVAYLAHVHTDRRDIMPD